MFQELEKSADGRKGKYNVTHFQCVTKLRAKKNKASNKARCLEVSTSCAISAWVGEDTETNG